MKMDAAKGATPRERARLRNLRIAAWASPVVLGGTPLPLASLLLLILGAEPPAAAVVVFVAFVMTLIGLITGLGLAIYFNSKRNRHLKDLRESLAANGISADDIEFFKNEMSSAERRSLSAIQARDEILADSYRDALASRLTATRILRSAKRELQLMRQREARVRRLSGSAEAREEIRRDISNLEKVSGEASSLLSEAQVRLQMLEAAAVRSGTVADSQVALKKLSARTQELPQALAHAKLTDEIRRELEKEEKE